MPNFKKSKGFQLKSGNTTPFKSMGASPAKIGVWQVDEGGTPRRITEEEAQIAQSQGAGSIATAGDKESISAEKLYPGKIIRDLSHGEEEIKRVHTKYDYPEEESDEMIARQKGDMGGKLWTSRGGYTRTETPKEQIMRDAEKQAKFEANVAAGRDPREEDTDYTGEIPWRR
jgi:hypothetical protein